MRYSIDRHNHTHRLTTYFATRLIHDCSHTPSLTRCLANESLSVPAYDNARRASNTPCIPVTSVQHLPLAALRIVLATGWIPPECTKQLQLVSLWACKDCRETTGFHVREVDQWTPRRLWNDTRARSYRRKRANSERVPPIRTEHLTFCDHYNRALTNVLLPPSLKSITFGDRFNKSLSDAQFPSTLVHVRFGDHFDQSLAGTVFPAGLRIMDFGSGFNHALNDVSWNLDLEVISLGSSFNKPLSGVVWPRGLRFLGLGADFNQPVEEGVVWPEGLQVLRFGDGFNQPVEAAGFPPAPRWLKFGRDFNQPVAEVEWPPLMGWLAFGCRFCQTLENVNLSQALEVCESLTCNL